MPTADPFEFLKALGSPRYGVAPMVEASELPFRMLCRKYGADIAWTPMFHSRLFTEKAKYRETIFTTCKEDRPLVVQFCANDPNILLEASKMVVDQCDAVEINLGCPQGIAKRGNYGAFLGEQWDIVQALVEILAKNLSIPVFCKIRILDSVERTIEYAKMIEKAGCSLLTIHGRTIHQRAERTGLADFSHIRAVKEALSIPVFTNGNVRNLEEADESMRQTNADGVMSACGLLRNPALFSGQEFPSQVIAREYLDFCVKYPVGVQTIRGHLFKLLMPFLRWNQDLRDRLHKADTFDICSEILDDITKRMEENPDMVAIAEAADREAKQKREAQNRAARASEYQEEIEGEENIFTSLFQE